MPLAFNQLLYNLDNFKKKGCHEHRRRGRGHHSDDKWRDKWRDEWMDRVVITSWSHIMELRCWWWFVHTKYIICTKLMTVKWDMQQKHGSPPRVTRKSSSYLMKCNDPCAFTALSMVDISYFVDAKHHCQHAAWKRMDAQWSEVFYERKVQWSEAWG